jgi:site-specific recombinase XerD
MVNKQPDYDSLPKRVNDYLYYMININRSEQTIFEYSLNLKEFLKYMLNKRNKTDDPDIVIKYLDDDFFRSIKTSDGYEYISYCRTVKQNGAAVRARKTVVLRQFFKFLYDHEHIIDSDPMASLKTPKQKKSMPKYLTLKDSKKLLESVDGKNKERDYCIITLFLNCGLRLSELVNINISDIRSDNSLVVTGKGNKERTIYLNEACISAVNAYLAVRPKDGVSDKNALFLSNRNKRISNRMVQEIVYEFIDKAGLGGRGISVHKLRHTAATLMYRYGHVDILVLKDILGHENLDTTSIYTHVVAEQVKDAIGKNPLSKEAENKTDENIEN